MGGRLSKGAVLRGLRFVHSWLGIFIVPWIIIIGATGLYLNHATAILSLIDAEPYEESQFAGWPGARPADLEAALDIAAGVWPDEPVLASENGVYHDKRSFILKKASGRVIVTRDTGHYFVKTNLTRTTFAPDGTRLHRRIYWGSIFGQLHTDGWVGGRLGSWLADITSVAMVVFGLTGIVLWWLPRARRYGRFLRRMGSVAKRTRMPESRAR
ncbi:MAG: hypothetical protein GY717_20970 [Rhodobacteraceae bacterium]|nr:hypothetical protein [Paracoccaceae bacterium]